jgi:hypothetical protein
MSDILSGSQNKCVSATDITNIVGLGHKGYKDYKQSVLSLILSHFSPYIYRRMKKEAVQREIQKDFRVELSVVSYRCNKYRAVLSVEQYQQLN